MPGRAVRLTAERKITWCSKRRPHGLCSGKSSVCSWTG